MALREKLPERYPAIIDMYAKGHANSLNLLKTDFGQWPPNGLDIVRAPDFDIKFKSVFRTSYGLKRLTPGIVNIAIAAALGGAMGAIYLGGRTLIRAMELGGFVEQGKSTIHVNDLYRGFSFFQSGRRFLSHVISHEFKHVVQGRDSLESLSSAFNERLNIKGKMEEGKDTQMRKYLASECEMQARLHTVIVGAYHQFEVMPVNELELLAVLHSQKIELPERQLNRLRETRSGRAALRKFTRDDDLYARYADKSAISDLNSVVRVIDIAHENSFWERDIPFIYGDLLELYGDSLGHKRMGHTHNIQLREVFYKAAQDVSDLQASQRFGRYLDGEGAEDVRIKLADKLSVVTDVIHQMPVDDAVDLGKMILGGHMYQEHGRVGYIPYTDDRQSIGRVAVDEIWSRAEITGEDRLSLRITHQQYAGRDRGSGFVGAGKIVSSLNSEAKFSDARAPVFA